MELDDRKKKILALVVENYIESAEPVGSKQIADNYENDISPATIRNEMKQLEEIGFLEQPHISAGRVPSTLGYRYYVDNLMSNNTLSMVDIDYINNNIVSYGSVEKTLEHAADVVSKLLNLPAVLNIKTTDVVENVKILKISEKILLIILMSNSGNVKDVIVQITDSLPETRMDELSRLLNKNLKGTPLENLSLALNDVVKKELSKFSNILNEMEHIVRKELDEPKNNMKGNMESLLALPEFSNTNEIKKFLNVVNTKEIINEVLNKIDKDDISVIIGNENNQMLLKDYSLISLDFTATDTTSATLGIVSPKRVDYKKAVSTLKAVNDRLKKIFGKEKEDKDGARKED
ncbi:MAG: heat-inducible transcription repressor HrcA [Clostridia bacterium]|nr:heat-inducible transcription repressor HrcA [Clostridia bacterium]